MPQSRKRIPFEFVLDALEPVPYRTNPMFGCTAIYVGEKIVLMVREKDGAEDDNGVWVAIASEHHESMQKELPSLRPIVMFGDKVSGWRNIPATSPTFEREALLACELVVARDPRVGKVPKKKTRAPAKRAKPREAGMRTRAGGPAPTKRAKSRR